MSIELINHSLYDDANLKAYYRFESGALTTDSSGEGHTLTAISDPAEDASGKFGGAVALDGDDGYSAVNHADLSPTGSFTLGAWVKSTYSGEVRQMIVQKSSAADYSFGMELDGNTGKLSANLYQSGGADHLTVIGTTDCTDGNWNFVVMVYNAATPSLTAYVNGSSEGTPDTTPTGTWFTDSTGLRIGTRTDGGGFFTGSIDDVFLINGTALSAAQVLDIYQNYAMSCMVGSFTLTGIDVILSKSLNILAETGSFVLTGIDVILRNGYTLIASIGEFTLTGIDVVFNKGFHLVCSVGEFTLTGMAASLKKLKIFSWTKQTKQSTGWTSPSKNNTNWTKPE